MGKTNTGLATRENRTICLPFPQDSYNKIVLNPSEFRKCIDGFIASFPDLFPPEIKEGYRMKDSYYSKKISIVNWRIEIAGTASDTTTTGCTTFLFQLLWEAIVALPKIRYN